MQNVTHAVGERKVGIGADFHGTNRWPEISLDPLDVIHVQIGDRDLGVFVGEDDMPRKTARRTAEVEHVAEGSLRNQPLHHPQVLDAARPIGEMEIAVISFAVDRGRNWNLVLLQRLERGRLVQVNALSGIHAIQLVLLAVELRRGADGRRKLPARFEPAGRVGRVSGAIVRTVPSNQS